MCKKEVKRTVDPPVDAITITPSARRHPRVPSPLLSFESILASKCFLPGPTRYRRYTTHGIPGRVDSPSRRSTPCLPAALVSLDRGLAGNKYDLDHKRVVGSKDGKGGAGVNPGGDDECVWRDWGLDRCREWGARWVLVEAVEISVKMVKGPRHLERRPGDWRREKATRAHLVIWSESPRNHGINYRVPAPLSL